MGKKSRRNTEGGSDQTVVETGFVSCVPCMYCDQVSFDSTDVAAYTVHLTNQHSITKNVDKLLQLTRELEATVRDVVSNGVTISSTTTDTSKENGVIKSVDGAKISNIKDDTSLPTPVTCEKSKENGNANKRNKEGDSVTSENNVSVIISADTKTDSEMNKKEKNTDNKEKADNNETAKKKANKSKNKKKDKKTEVEAALPDGLSDIGAAASGVVEKEDMKAADNITDEWFKSGKEDIDDDIPDELPDISKNKPIVSESENPERVQKKPEKANKSKTKRNNKKTEVKVALADGLPNIGAAASGVVEKEDMKAVDNILDEWFKAGKEDIDDDIPDELPDISDPQPVVLKSDKTEKVQKKAENKKSDKISHKKKSKEEKTSKKETSKTGKKNLDEVNDILDEWFTSSEPAAVSNKPEKKKEKEDNKKPTEPTNNNKKTAKKTGKNNLDEVNDILDEWFTSDEPGIDELKEKLEPQEIIEPKPSKKKDKKPLAKNDSKNCTKTEKPAIVEEPKFVDITEDKIVEIDDEPLIEEKTTEKTDLDEVNDILDEWFANEDEEDVIVEEMKVEEVTSQLSEKAVSSTPQPKPEIQKNEKEEKKMNEKEAVKKEKEEEEREKEKDVPCGDCVVCGRLAKAACSGCKHIFYCTREHQRRDWSSHKENCKAFAKLPYRVERSPVLGRFLAATKEIPEGELILQESPMVVGPRQLTKPVCLGCHQEIKSADEMITCIRCNWPLCSRRCQDSPMHDPECRATKAAGSRIKVEVFGQTNMMYACITVLRTLALLDGPKKIWDDYTKFDSHLDERIKTPIYSKVNKEKVVFFIHHYLGIKRYSDLEILEACGKLDTNCFEIRQAGVNLRAMYRTACILSHDCTPNSRHTFAPDNSINVYTTRKLNKGDVISATYTNTLWPTSQRREHLYMSKFFWCSCARCRDPTELGSMLSAVRCSRCKGFNDDVQSNDAQYLTSTNPLDTEATWRCSKCTNVQKATQIKSGNKSITNELSQVNRSNSDQLLTFLHKNEPILGRNNHNIVEAKYSLVSLLGNRAPYNLSDLSMELLQIKERFCRELLDVADCIEPGSSRWRGTLLLELQMAVVALAAGQAECGMISRGKAKEGAEEAMKMLRVATAILQVEPDMREILAERMKSMTELFAQWED